MTALAVANSNPSVIYAARRMRFEYYSPPGVYRTTDDGNNWSDITSNLPDSLYYTSIDVSQTDANTAYIALAGLTAGEKVYKTINGGTSWQNISYNLPNAPVNAIKTAPGTDRVVVSTDFGVFILNESSGIWIDESLGLPNVITSDLEFNTALNKVYVSTFGRGIWETDISALLGLGKTEQAVALDIELFPSPNNGSFTINVLQKDLLNETLHLEIIDITGRLVYAKDLEGKLSYKLAPSLPSGMFFAKIKSKTLNGVKSFVVQ